MASRPSSTRAAIAALDRVGSADAASRPTRTGSLGGSPGGGSAAAASSGTPPRGRSVVATPQPGDSEQVRQLKDVIADKEATAAALYDELRTLSERLERLHALFTAQKGDGVVAAEARAGTAAAAAAAAGGRGGGGGGAGDRTSTGSGGGGAAAAGAAARASSLAAAMAAVTGSDGGGGSMVGGRGPRMVKKTSYARAALDSMK